MFMYRQRRRLALVALALVALLLVPAVSSAQFRGLGARGWSSWSGYGYGNWGQPYYGGYSSYGWGSPYSYGGSPYYVTPGTSYSYPQTYGYSVPIFDGSNNPPMSVSQSQSFYPPDGRIQGAMDNTRAYVHVRVRPDAQVFFDNSPTRQTGADRNFMTPQLDSNRRYSYDVSARWMENGEERRENRTVNLTPGQTAEVDFVNQRSPQDIR
jgi:uncharacterized protein (TIGR03000 family)